MMDGCSSAIRSFHWRRRCAAAYPPTSTTGNACGPRRSTRTCSSTPATGTPPRPVTGWWIRHQLGICGQRIRFDRILDEAHATGGDIRRLIDLFGLSFETANRYATTVNRLARPKENQSGNR